MKNQLLPVVMILLLASFLTIMGIGIFTIVDWTTSDVPVAVTNAPPSTELLRQAYNNGVLSGSEQAMIFMNDIGARRVILSTNTTTQEVVNMIFERIRTNRPGQWARYYD